QPRHRDLGGVARGAGDLVRPVDAVDRHADYGHDAPPSACDPVASASARTIARRANSTLKALPERVTAGASSARAAASNDSGVAGAPRSAASAARARHGLVPTPPSARRTSVTVPLPTSIAVQTETRANS